MATLLVKHRVANFEEWKKVFDSMDKVRKEHGFTGSTVHRDATDPNIVVIVNHVRSLEGAKKYGGSQQLRDAMAHGGVLGMPEINFLNDVG
jgi:quinol monooxygenase YgiN